MTTTTQGGKKKGGVGGLEAKNIFKEKSDADNGASLLQDRHNTLY